MSYNYKRFEIKPGEHFITVIYLGSGWAAVEMWLNNENYNETYQEEECFFFFEPYNTGIGRYATEEEAMKEANKWSESDDIRIII